MGHPARRTAIGRGLRSWLFVDVRRAWVRWRWGMLSGGAVLAVVLGMWGFDLYFTQQGTPQSTVNTLYHSLGLFAFEGGRILGPIPWPLEIARFLAPLVVLAAALGTVFAVFHHELQRAWARWFLANHVIVVGAGPVGLRLACQLITVHRTRCAVVELRDDHPNQAAARRAGIPMITGDGGDSSDIDLVERTTLRRALERAGINRADSVIVTTGSTELNVLFADVLIQLREEGCVAPAYVELDALDAATGLIARTALTPFRGVECFSLAERGAKSLLDRLDARLGLPLPSRAGGTASGSAAIGHVSEPALRAGSGSVSPSATGGGGADGDDVEPDPRRHLVIVGQTSLGRNVAVQAARNWARDIHRLGESGPRQQAGPTRGSPTGPHAAPLVTLVVPLASNEDDVVPAGPRPTPDPRAAIAESAAGAVSKSSAVLVGDPAFADEARLLRLGDPRLGDPGVCDLHIVCWDPDHDPLDDVLSCPPTTVVVTAMTGLELVRLGTTARAAVDAATPVWLCTDQADGLVNLVVSRMRTEDGPALDVFAVLDNVLAQDTIRRGVDDELARAVHQAHVRYGQDAPGTVEPSGQAGSTETQVPWDQLAPAYRRLNYRVVRAWRKHLEDAGYRLVPYRTVGAERTRLPDDVVERIARQLHAVWNDEKKRQGYVQGPSRNDDRSLGALTHPDIDRPFDDLPDAGRQWNLTQAAATPEHLAAAGLQLDPLPEETGWTDDVVEALAKAYHRLYRDQTVTVGHVTKAGEREWDELAEADRRSNRESVKAIPAHLARMGYETRLASGDDGDVAPLRLPVDRVELAAVAEHDRWCAAMRADGYVVGPRRSGTAVPPTHPDLVAWQDLDEATRDRDRVRIRAIPELLASVGYEVVPVTDPATSPGAARPARTGSGEVAKP
jgi:TrkA-N domain